VSEGVGLALLAQRIRPSEIQYDKRRGFRQLVKDLAVILATAGDLEEGDAVGGGPVVGQKVRSAAMTVRPCRARLCSPSGALTLAVVSFPARPRPAGAGARVSPDWIRLGGRLMERPRRPA
jgi:hypothetical protein